jgi:hypothetical protein
MWEMFSKEAITEIIYVSKEELYNGIPNVTVWLLL